MRARGRRGAITWCVVVAALVAVATAAVTARAAPSPAAGAAAFLVAEQGPSGGWAERGRQPDAALTAWAALGLVAADGSAAARTAALTFLRIGVGDTVSENDLSLRVVALAALGEVPDDLVTRLRAYRPGVLVNATIWTVIALRAAGQVPSAELVEDLRATQSKTGGWSWARGGAPDSNDTAAAIQALRAAGVGGVPVRRALAALHTFQNHDGGFALTKGRESDAQSTAWAIQAQLAAGLPPGKAAFRYLARLRRKDGSYRYSVRYATTPVWVTAQVLSALAGRWFPL